MKVPDRMFSINTASPPLAPGKKRRVHIYEEKDDETGVSLCGRVNARIADLRMAFQGRSIIRVGLVRCAECEKLFSGLSIEREVG